MKKTKISLALLTSAGLSIVVLAIQGWLCFHPAKFGVLTNVITSNTIAWAFLVGVDVVVLAFWMEHFNSKTLWFKLIGVVFVSLLCLLGASFYREIKMNPVTSRLTSLIDVKEVKPKFVTSNTKTLVTTHYVLDADSATLYTKINGQKLKFDQDQIKYHFGNGSQKKQLLVLKVKFRQLETKKMTPQQLQFLRDYLKEGGTVGYLNSNLKFSPEVKSVDIYYGSLPKKVGAAKVRQFLMQRGISEDTANAVTINKE